MKILFVSLPPYILKKPGNYLYFLQDNQNLGMLATATAASMAGHDVRVIDWLGPQQCDLIKILDEIFDKWKPSVVGISVISGYAEPYLDMVSFHIREKIPNTSIVVGGQYHAGFRANKILARNPSIDAIAIGEGEHINWSAFKAGISIESQGFITRENLSPQRINSQNPSQLDWSLYELPLSEYAPSIELTRGCPYKCTFCSLSGAPTRLSQGDAVRIREQLRFWLDYWSDLSKVPIYAECPVFFCTENNINYYRNCFCEAASRAVWRVQARVDSVEPSVFPELFKLGLRVIDLGLESASHRMLLLMGKTHNPDNYLKKAKKFIKSASAAGIGVKLNLLLYPGETEETAAQTFEFVLQHSSDIIGVSASSTIEFPGTTLSQKLNIFSEKFGTTRVVDPIIANAGIFPLNLSRDFNYERAREWCLQISRYIMTAENYFHLKRIGYYSPTKSYSEFLAAASKASYITIPFRYIANGEKAYQQEITNTSVNWDILR